MLNRILQFFHKIWESNRQLYFDVNLYLSFEYIYMPNMQDNGNAVVKIVSILPVFILCKCVWELFCWNVLVHTKSSRSCSTLLVLCPLYLSFPLVPTSDTIDVLSYSLDKYYLLFILVIFLWSEKHSRNFGNMHKNIVKISAISRWVHCNFFLTQIVEVIC